jgi:hypothetical protein
MSENAYPYDNHKRRETHQHLIFSFTRKLPKYVNAFCQANPKFPRFQESGGGATAGMEHDALLIIALWFRARNNFIDNLRGDILKYEEEYRRGSLYYHGNTTKGMILCRDF